MKRRFISVMLALAMVFSIVMPATVRAIPGEETETAVELVSWDFEEGAEDWTFIDADEDGYNWIWYSNEGATTGRMTTHDGEGLIFSGSYDNDTGSQLFPDNWAISPAFSLAYVKEATLSIWAQGQDEDYADEVFALYAGVSLDPDKMTKISDDITATGKYVNYTADLSDFIGKDEVYFAIRHYNVTDMFYLDVDDVAIMVVPLPDACPDGTHSLTYHPETTEATCTDGVHAAYYKCDVCERTFLDAEGLVPVILNDITTVPALGHDWLKGVSNGDGTHTHSCSRCDATLTEDCTFEEKISNGVSKVFCPECGYATYSEISGEDLLVGWGFEDEESIEGWTMSDKDGDGYCWWWGEGEEDAYEGQRFLYSASWYSGEVLTPDNWLFTPAFSLKGYKEAKVSLWARGYFSSYCNETFAIYAGTSDNPDEMVKISEDITTEYAYLKFTADLSDFAGEPVVYVAIRHYNCSDVYYLLLDLVEIYATSADLCEEHTLTFVPAVAPTETEDGNIAYYYCEECGRYYLDEEATQPVLPEDVIIPALGAPEFTSHRLVLTGEVGVQFKVTLPDGFVASGSSMSFDVSDGRKSTMNIEDATPVDGENAYWFTCYLNALELADTITATFKYGTDGAVINTYSAMEYIDTIQSQYDDYEEAFVIVRDFRNYGRYLQLSGWNDGRSHETITNFNGTELTDDDLEYVRSALYDNEGMYINIDGTGVEDVKFALTLNSQTVINFFVKLAEEEEIVSCEGCTLVGTQTIGGDTYYKFKTEEINALELQEYFVATIKTTGATVDLRANALNYIDIVVREGSTFSIEKQYAMAAYFFFAQTILLFAGHQI